MNVIIYSISCHSKPEFISSVEHNFKHFVHAVEIKWFGTILHNLLLCSTEESRLEQYEGEEMMTEFISSTFQQSSSKSMLYCPSSAFLCDKNALLSLLHLLRNQ